VAVIEALGPADGSGLGLDITGERVSDPLRFLLFAPGSPATATTGHIPFPASGRLWFRFQAVPWAPQIFQGAYRFWTYAVDRAPEHRASTVPLSAEIRGESIDRSGDLDEFRFTVAAGDELNAFLQAPRPFLLEITPPSGSAIASVTAPSGADTGLFRVSTGRFQFQQAGTYLARVSGSDLIADTGAYRFFLYHVDRRPEHAPQALTAGDTVASESIDLPGDVDEFTFSATAGQELNAFLQARDGSPNTHLMLEAVDVDGTVLGSAYSAGSDTSLLEQATGRFAARSTGTQRLRVKAAPFAGIELSTGPYRLFLYRVNRLPESRPATLTFGDSVFGESIDVPGDVDEFQVTVPESSGANLLIELPAAPPGSQSIVAQLVNLASGEVALSTSVNAAGASPSSRARLGPGAYVLRVTATEYAGVPQLRGPYRVWLNKFSYRPEVARDTLAIGDTVSVESIDPLGDEDDFVFFGTRGQRINLALQGRGPAPGGAFEVSLSNSSWPHGPLVTVGSPSMATELGDHQTLRYDLPYTGWYQLAVSGAGPAGATSAPGPYRLAVTPAGTAPESVSAVLLPGDSVAPEALDFLGDVDEFRVTAGRGRELNVVFDSPAAPSGNVFPRVLIVDPATGDSLDGEVAQGMRVAGPIQVPASGQLSITVYEPRNSFYQRCSDATCNGALAYTGPYGLRLFVLDRAPERVPAAYVQGDTVRGEALFPFGDIDEFHASGAPGDTLSPWLHLAAAPLPTGSWPTGAAGMITIEIVDPATGSVIAGGMSLTGAGPEFYSPGPFIVPAAGAYLVRIRGTGGFGEDLGTAPYEFFVKRGR
jgi:hypothetical protein